VHPLTIMLCARSLPVYRGVPHLLVPLLQANGHRVTQVGDGALDLSAPDLVWINGNANWYPAVCRQLTSEPVRRPLVVLWHSEPLPPPRAAGLPIPRLHLREIAKIVLRDSRATDVYSNSFRIRKLARHGLPDILVVSTGARQEFLAEHGISAHVVPLGYHPTHGRDLGLQRDIDTLFLGSLDVPRRRRLLKQLRRRGVNVVERGSWFDPANWGEERVRLLNRTKILLNFGRYPGELSGMRLILGLANKALVISEPIYRPAPYVPGTHYVSATIEEMPEVIRYYLAHEDERQRIVAEGHRLVMEEITLERSAARILGLVAECLDGTPTHAPGIVDTTALARAAGARRAGALGGRA
jgi:glycosyltransferase involved in cell wall biosynthesis